MSEEAPVEEFADLDINQPSPETEVLTENKEVKLTAPTPAQLRENKRCYVKFSSIPNSRDRVFNFTQAGCVEGILMRPFPTGADYLAVTIDGRGVVRVFHKWAAAKRYYVQDVGEPLYCKSGTDNRS
eukprot:g40090.t1